MKLPLKRVREPAVAGLFYPGDAAALTSNIDDMLAGAPSRTLPGLKGLVCPHAGYRYSGPVAAHAYKLLAGRTFKTVIVLAPSHYAAFDGAYVSGAEVYRTPLGEVPIASLAQELAKSHPFVGKPRGRVHRPQWAFQASRPLPAPGEEAPDTWEHSDEVQVPFLQRTLKTFEMVPIVLGEVDPEQVARGLAGHLNEQTLIVASSDLSHYHPYDTAKALDGRCVKAICNMDLEQMKDQEACGKGPVMVLMHLARLKGWKPQLLDYRNSGDTSGDKSSGVVGYAAIAFTAAEGAAAEGAAAAETEQFSRQDKKFLLELARKSLRSVVAGSGLPTVEEQGLAKKFTLNKGCFVTLTKNGQLRGCIGHIMPMEPLYKAVMDNARDAALRDTRFPPVRPEEVDKIEVEVSVLTVPQPLAFSSPDDLLNKLRPHRDGVVLQVGGARSTFLPQVWEQLPDKVEFLNHLSQKAGAAASDWRKPGTTVSTYQVEAFKEKEF